MCRNLSVFAQDSKKEIASDEKETTKKKEEDKKDEPKGPKWFSLNPGVTLESVTVDITGRGHNATMTQGGPGRSTWMFDVKSRNIQFTENIGVYLLLHNSEFLLNNQFLPKVAQADAPSSSESSGSSSSGSSPSSDGRAKQNIGTRIRGNYTMAIPVLFYGNDKIGRIGIGAGQANVSMNGSADFQNPLNTYAFLGLDSSNKVNFLDTVSKYQFITGNINPVSGDPVATYLLSNLSQGNNLELLGLYYASQGLLRNPDVISLLPYIRNPRLYSPIEAYALASLAVSNVNFARQNVFSFMAYYETPKFGYFRFRLAFGGPVFKDNGYKFEFTTFHLALFVPIEF